MKKIVFSIILVVAILSTLVVSTSAANVTNVAAGASYTRTGGHVNNGNNGTDSGYAYDMNGVLTDGVIKPEDGSEENGAEWGIPGYGASPCMWFNFHWLGSDADSVKLGDNYYSNVVTLDLGKKLEDLTSVVIYGQEVVSPTGTPCYTITAPDYIKVFGSDDGENFTELGDITATKKEVAKGIETLGTPGVENVCTLYSYTFTGDFAARYVRIEVAQKANWTSFSEIEVLQKETVIEIPSTEESSKGGSTPTGDSGYVAGAIIALITLAGVYVVKKAR
ncbi:discoidin domain-containing protein [Eubacteriales bacterium OttesenSCG-928-G02]|nr:discoidin domain-containing protein [Eubacteriales bacterium OttesenSCG-928-G02]